MSEKFSQVTNDLSLQLKKLRQEMPDTMAAFSALAQAATQDGALDKKTKELIALSLGISGHCQGCIGFHVQTLVKLGLKREELMETLAMAVYMGGGPSLMFAAEALEAFEEFSN